MKRLSYVMRVLHRQSHGRCTAARRVAAAGVDTPLPRGPMNDFSQISAGLWIALSRRTMHFGHQGVGGDVIEGLQALLAARPDIGLRVACGASFPAPGVFNSFHVGAGALAEPLAAAFLEGSRSELGPDPVLMIEYGELVVAADPDVDTLLDRYQQAVAALRARHPQAVIVHVTLPLSIDSKMRNFVSILRGQPMQRERNALRTRYNALLRAAYAGKEPVYDLAAVQSTRSDGTVEYVHADGERVYALAPEWALKGGRLNAAGRRRAAEDLLATLASLP